MTDTSDRAKSIDGWQGACVMVGIFAGLLPLARVLIGGGPGRPMQWLNGQLGDPPTYLVPICVILLAVALIALLERAKQQP